MQATITIQADSLKSWINNPQRPILIRDAMDRIRIGGENILKSAEESISTTGNLNNSIHSLLSTEGANTYQIDITSDAAYADVALEFGRKPGKMPSIDALIRWVSLKGLGESKVRDGMTGKIYSTSTNSSIKSIAFLIARKIAQSGTQKYQDGGPKLESDTFDQLVGETIPIELDNIGLACVVN